MKNLIIQVTITIKTPGDKINVENTLVQTINRLENAFVGSTVEVDDWDLEEA